MKQKTEKVDALKVKEPLLKHFIRNWQLYAMLAVPVVFFFLFHYLPMGGLVIAFKDYNIFGEGMYPGEWVGLAHFKEAFASSAFWQAFNNTLILNLGQLVIGFPIPIILAVALNELRSDFLRKTTQVITYLPHFLSWVIISGISYQVFASTGILNTFLGYFGIEKVAFLTDSNNWRWVYWIAGIWQGAGYSLIIFLAALMGVDTTLYEAAYIDGANRMQRIWNVTLPMIRPTITIMLIMNIGHVVSIGFDKPYMLSNALVKDVANVLSTHVYSVGIGAARFDFATAIGLFQSVLSVIMVLGADTIAKKLGEEGLL